MTNKTPKQLQDQIYSHEAALEDLLDMSKMYSGHQFNLRLNNMIMTRFSDLAKKLNLKEIKYSNEFVDVGRGDNPRFRPIYSPSRPSC